MTLSGSPTIANLGKHFLRLSPKYLPLQRYGSFTSTVSTVDNPCHGDQVAPNIWDVRRSRKVMSVVSVLSSMSPFYIASISDPSPIWMFIELIVKSLSLSRDVLIIQSLDTKVTFAVVAVNAVWPPSFSFLERPQALSAFPLRHPAFPDPRADNSDTPRESPWLAHHSRAAPPSRPLSTTPNDERPRPAKRNAPRSGYPQKPYPVPSNHSIPMLPD